MLVLKQNRRKPKKNLGTDKICKGQRWEEGSSEKWMVLSYLR